MNIYAFNNFGYEGNVVTVEADLRKGVPAFDIVGLADEATKFSRENIRAGIKNSGLEFPSDRILVSLTSGNTQKEGAGYDFPVAMAILNSQMEEKNIDKNGNDKVLVLGELKLSGEITPVRGAVAAAETASSFGINKVICHSGNAEELSSIPGLKISAVENLVQALEAMQDREKFVENTIEKKDSMAVEFNVADKELLETARNFDVKGLYQSCHALEVAIAGKHNLYFTGSYSPEKSELIQAFVPTLTPKMTDEEARVTSRIKSIAGLNHGFSVRERNAIPFRIPYQTATLEGICGGGRNAMPGEISLANNGVLFLDNVDEFRSSTIQLLRIPINAKNITLSKGSMSTTYPAKFQLMMAGNSCACGNFGSSSKLCLCSAASVKKHTDKIPSSLMVSIEIKDFVERNPKDKRTWNFDDAQKRIKKAYEIQRKRGTFNADLSPDEIREYCKLDEMSEKFFEDAVKNEEFSTKQSMNFLKVALTLANLDGREKIMLKDIKDAYRLSIPVLDSSYTLQIDKKSSLDKNTLEIEKGRQL